MKNKTRRAFAILGLVLLYIQAFFLLQTTSQAIRGFGWWTGALTTLLFVSLIYTPELAIALSLSKAAAKKRQRTYVNWLIFPLAMIPITLWADYYGNFSLITNEDGRPDAFGWKITGLVILFTLYAFWGIWRVTKTKATA